MFLNVVRVTRLDLLFGNDQRNQTGHRRRSTVGYIKLKINSCAFICIWPHLTSLYNQRFSHRSR